MPSKTLDQIVAQQLGQMNLALIRQQAQIDALTEERDRLVAEVADLKIQLTHVTEEKRA